MNAKPKSLFIFPAIAGSLILLAISCYMAITAGHDRIAWLGSAIASIPLPLIMARISFFPVERTSENLPLFLLIAFFGLLVAFWQQFFEGTSGWSPTLLAMAGTTLFLLYVFWYSRFGRVDSHQLAVGEKLPEFVLKNAAGDEFHSSSLAGAPAILLFYAGNWCPFCMAQIAEIADKYQDIQALGIQVVLISPQPDEQSRVMSVKYNVPFKFLVDSGNRVADALGIGIKNGVPTGMPGGYSPDTVMPTLIVSNASGTIVFSDQTDNYRVRPEPDVFLAILRRAGVMAK